VAKLNIAFANPRTSGQLELGYPVACHIHHLDGKELHALVRKR